MVTHAESTQQVQRMDRMYRWTRHVYDLSRKYFLFGRDRLLKRMQLDEGDRVLEMGCGTARNLIKLARMKPGHDLFGLDASNTMLETAEAKITRAGLADTITVTHALAEDLDHQKLFNLDKPFDVIFFSYSLSMMPTWPEALEAALANLKEKGRIYIVDFWDQQAMPGWVARAFKRYLAHFHVHFRPELLDRLHEIEAEGRVTMELETIGKRYAYLATLQREG